MDALTLIPLSAQWATWRLILGRDIQIAACGGIPVRANIDMSAGGVGVVADRLEPRGQRFSPCVEQWTCESPSHKIVRPEHTFPLHGDLLFTVNAVFRCVRSPS